MDYHQTVRDAIKTLLESVEGVANVHTYERYNKRGSDLKSFYQKEDDSIHGWYIRRLSWKETPLQLDGPFWLYQDWEIRAFMGFVDDQKSELAFDTLLDAVANAFRSNPTFSGTVTTPEQNEAGRLQLVVSEPVSLCGALCHGAKLHLTTKSYVDPTPPYEGGPLSGAKVGISPDVGPPHVDDYKGIIDG